MPLLEGASSYSSCVLRLNMKYEFLYVLMNKTNELILNKTNWFQICPTRTGNSPNFFAWFPVWYLFIRQRQNLLGPFLFGSFHLLIQTNNNKKNLHFNYEPYSFSISQKF